MGLFVLDVAAGDVGGFLVGDLGRVQDGLGFFAGAGSGDGEAEIISIQGGVDEFENAGKGR